jgi:photosystem II PsbY protein
MDLDFRVVVVLLPVILAGSWAVFNIAKAALTQIQGFLAK